MVAVTFDIWGTLLDLNKFYLILSRKLSMLCSRDVEEVYRSVLRTYREALRVRLSGVFSRIILDSAEFFSKKLEVPVEYLLQAVATSIDDPGIAELAYSDSVDALESVKSSGYRVAALGNVMFWPGALTRYILHRNGLLSYFDLTVFSDEVGLQKPNREIFEYVAAKLGVSVGDIVHVGDSPENDLAGALVAGAGAVLINRNSPLRVVRLGRNSYLVNDLRILTEVLKEIASEQS